MERDNCTGIYFCRNYKCELTDQTSNMSDVIRNLVGDDVRVVPVTTDAAWDELMHSLRTNDAKTLYVAMASTPNHQKIFDRFRDGDEIKFTCAVDEADQYLGDNAVSRDLKLLLSAAICKYYISATLLDISSLIDADDILTAIPSTFAFQDEVDGDDRQYRSLHRCLREDLLNPGRTLDDAVENGRLSVAKALRLGWNLEYNEKGLPFTVCHFHSNTNADNESIARQISSRPIAGVSIPVVTFDMTGTKVYEAGQCSREFPALNQALQALKLESKEVVYLMGGQMCSRAFRITDTEHEMYISMLIYGWGDNSDASLVVQRLGRMCGVSPKELVCPQRIFVDKKTFYRAVDCTNATTEWIRAAFENPDDVYSEMLEKVRISQRHTSSNTKLSQCRVEQTFTVDEDRASPHGMLQESVGTNMIADGMGQIRKVDVSLIRDRTQHMDIYDYTLAELRNKGIGVWHPRPAIAREIQRDYERDFERAITVDHIFGDLRRFYQNKSTPTNDTTANGFLIGKRGRDVYLRLNE